MFYFDHNATTPLLPAARQAWLEAAELFIGNPSSPHRIGARADAALQDARERLALILDCDPADIVWTSGATESNNLVLHNFAKSARVDAEVWVSAIEHPCVLRAAQAHFGRRCRSMPVTRGGIVDLEWFKEQVRKRSPAMVALMAANNETGVLQPWRTMLALCRERGIPFFCDAAQWLGKLPAAGLGDCDFLSGCAHKFGGPRGVGFLKCPADRPLFPLLIGGKQEDGRRGGTENVAGVLSMLAALEANEAVLRAGTRAGRIPEKKAANLARRQDTLQTRSAPVLGRSNVHPALRPIEACCARGRAHSAVVYGTDMAISLNSQAETLLPAVRSRLKCRERFEASLLESLPGSQMVGRGENRLWNTVCALLPETGTRRRWVVKLDKLGFAVSTGSACASGREEPSHVLAAMGYSNAEAGRVLRFSSWWQTTSEDWRALGKALVRGSQAG